MDEETRLLVESKKWALPERVSHTSWKVRQAAYEDVLQNLSGVYDEGDPLLSEYGSLFVKAVADSNAAAQDKALEALNAFLAKASDKHVERSVDKVCANIVSKALNGRTSTVLKATDALLTFVELEQASAVVDALLAGFNHKVPKVVVACIDITQQILSAYGTKVIIHQPIIKALPPLFDTKDAKAREKVKVLVVELARWVTPEVIRAALFKDMRDATKTEIEAALQSLAKEKPKPMRFTRKEMARQAALTEKEDAHGSPDADAEGDTSGALPAEEDLSAEADPYDFAEPKDVLRDLKKEFWENLESKKWSDRKGSLTQFKELCTYPHLASSRDVDYGDINRELRKIITKDSNVMCVAEAVACTGQMAKGLRQAYSATAKGMIDALLEKFKEKNANVTKAISEALGLMHKYCFCLLDVQESVQAALGHANPKIKEETLNWLKEAVQSEKKDSLGKLAQALLPAAAKCAEEATPSLREAALAFFVGFTIKFGNSGPMDKYTAKLDDAKKKRLEEMMVEAGAAKPSAAGSRPGAAGSSASSSAPPRPIASPRQPSAAAAALAAARKGPGAAVRSSLSAASAPSKAAGSAAASGSKKSAAPAKETEAEDEVSLMQGALSRDEAVVKFTDLFGEEVVKKLQNSDWKARLEGMEEVLGRATDGSLNSSTAIVCQGLAQLPGWAEKNFQVMGKQFEVIRVLATDAPNFGRRDACVGINGIFEKMSDMKLKGPGSGALTAMAEAVGPAFVATLLHNKAAKHTNPKLLAEVLGWISTSIEEFGLTGFNVKLLLSWIKEDINHANAVCRNSTCKLLGVLHRFLGPPLGDMIRADVKSATMSAVETEFSKNPQVSGFTPTRVSRADTAKQAAGGGKSSSSKGADAGSSSPPDGGFDSDDLLPRTDISGGILSSNIIPNLSSSAWKERLDAMEAVDSLITSAGGRIQPELGELVPALKGRMADTNKNLVVKALQLLGKLAKAMGKPIDRQARSLLGPALKNLSDNKPNVRAAVSEMMTDWVSVANPEGLVVELMEVLTSPKCTADGKAEGISWLATLVSSGKAAGHVPDCLKAVSLGSGDKTAAAREAAGKLVAALLAAFAPAQLAQATSVLEPAVKKAVNEALTKAGGALPAVAPAAAARPATAPSVRTSMSKPVSASSAAGVRSSISRPGTASVRSSLALNRSVNLGSGSQQQPDNGPLILPDNKKEDRAKKGKYRPAKLDIRPDEPAQVEAEMTPVISSQLKALMFSKDFKQHCQAADLLRETIPTAYDSVLAINDLLLRWATLRILEGNTQVLVKLLDMLRELLAAMEDRGDKLSEYECKLILPVLVEKAGHNQDKIKEMFRELLRCCALVHPPQRVAIYMKDGLESKNNKSRVVVAEELGHLISSYGPNIYRSSVTVSKIGSVPDSVLISLAKLVAERDQSLRSAALGCFEVVYAIEADGLWRHLGKLSDASRTLVEERLKYTDKELAKKGVRPGYRAAEFGEETPASGATHPASPRNTASSSAMRPQSPSMIRPPSPSGGQRGSSSPTPMAISPSPQPRSTGATTGSNGSILAGMHIARNLPSSEQSVEPSTAAQASQDVVMSDAQTMAFMRASSMGPTAASTVSSSGVSGVSPIASLNKSSEAALRQDFARCMGILAGSDMDEAVGVMKMLCYELMGLQSGGQGVALAFRDNMERLVGILATQTDSIFASAGTAIASGRSPNVRACKYALNTMMHLFQYPWLASVPSGTTLHHLMSVLLCCLVDERLAGMQEGVALLKALNLLMMKILENCNRTQVYIVLIDLLRNPYERVLALPGANADRDKQEAKWFDLAVKCTIKLTKFLPVTVDSLDLPQLLLAIHKFFDALGGPELRRRGATEDKPLRMVKTLLHELCRHKGRAIFNYTGLIPGADLEPAMRPVIFPYIDLNLQTTANNNTTSAAGAFTSPARAAQPSHLPHAPSVGAEAPSNVLTVNPNAVNTSHANTQPPPMSAGPKMPTAAVVPPAAAVAPSVPAQIVLQPSEARYGQPASDEGAARTVLANIFKRISDSTDRQQALIDLYFFSVANPDRDFENFLSGSSNTFKTYITRGLRKIKQHMAEQGGAQQAQANQSYQAWGSAAGSPDETVVTMGDHMSGNEGLAPINLAQMKLSGGGLNGDRSSGGGAPGSPMSPGMKAFTRAAPVVGENKIAELKERMNHITADVAAMPPPNRASTQLHQARSGAASGANSGIPTPSLHSPSPSTNELAVGGGTGGGLAMLQERMRKLREQETS